MISHHRLLLGITCGLTASGVLLGASTARADSDHQASRWRNVQIVADGFITGMQLHPTERGRAGTQSTR